MLFESPIKRSRILRKEKYFKQKNIGLNFTANSSRLFNQTVCKIDGGNCDTYKIYISYSEIDKHH